MTRRLEFIIPNWPAPANIRAVTTTRPGGVSVAPYDSLNLSDHVGDIPANIKHNRQVLFDALNLPSKPIWLKQVHGTHVIDAVGVSAAIEADGSYTRRVGTICAVMTADCLPVFLCDRNGSVVSLLHVGWRGLTAGVIESGVRQMHSVNSELLAWLGPAIGPDAFEIGDEVRTVFLRQDMSAEGAFQPTADGRWLADLYALARLRLQAQGVVEIYGGSHCTFSEKDKFFSYRRDGNCGRMASLIWLAT